MFINYLKVFGQIQILKVTSNLSMTSLYMSDHGEALENQPQPEVPKEEKVEEKQPCECKPCEPQAPHFCETPKFSPHAVYKFVLKFPTLIENIQGMLYWRRPVPMALWIIIMESIFIFIKRAQLTFLPVVCMLTTFYILGKAIISKYGDKLLAILFPPLANDGRKEELSNQVWPVEEVGGIAICMGGRIWGLKTRICKKLTQPGLNGLLVRIGVLTGLFFLFWTTTTYWFIFGILHFFTFFPGIIMYPSVHVHFEKFIAHQRETCSYRGQH